MNKDNDQLLNLMETDQEAQDSIMESAWADDAAITDEFAADAIDRSEREASDVGEQLEETSVLNSAIEIESLTEAGIQTQEQIMEPAIDALEILQNEASTERPETVDRDTEAGPEASGPRENESAIAWLERLEREARAADEKVKATAIAVKSARAVEAEAKREVAHSGKRLKTANQQVRETLDNKYQAECTAEIVIERLQAHKILAAKNAEEQAVKEARERARYEAEELKWQSKKAAQEAQFRVKWEAETGGEQGGKQSAASKGPGEVKAEAKREAAQIRDRLNHAISQAKRDAQEALDRAKREGVQAAQEISQEAKDRIEQLHQAILRAIAYRNEVKVEADSANDRWEKKLAALKSAIEAHKEAKRELAEAKKRLRQAMSAAKNESKEVREKAKQKAKEATMVASGNELSGFVRLQVARPMTPGPIREFELALAQTGAFRVESVGGTIDDGAYIDLFIEEPVHLLGMLSELPHIEGFWKNDKGIKVELNTAA